MGAYDFLRSSKPAARPVSGANASKPGTPAPKAPPSPAATKADLAAAEARAWAKGFAAATQRAALIIASPTGRRNLDKSIKLLAQPEFLHLDAAAAITLIGQAAAAEETKRAAEAKVGWGRAVSKINKFNRLGDSA